MDVKNINTTALAYIGDAVYEVAVREYVMHDNPVNVDALHKRAIRFVRADGQAFAIKKFMHERENDEAPVTGASSFSLSCMNYFIANA